MSLPAGIAGVTITGKLVSPDGSPANGSVTFTPSVAVLYQGAKAVILPAVVSVPLDATGAFTVTLPSTDDNAGNPTGWTYRVEERIRGGRVFSTSLPKSPASIDYSTLMPTPTSTGNAVLNIDGGTP